MATTERPERRSIGDRAYDMMFHNYVWRSVFRSGYPDTPRNQMLVVATNVFLHLHPTRLHRTHVRITHTFCLGGLSFFLFIGLTITGVLLMFYYVPSVERAYVDMQRLETDVRFGMLMRNLHRWMAHGMVLTVLMHMMRVFYTGAYKPPREFNWVVGVVLLVLTLLLSFTGYLLPWDELAFWAITVGTNMVGSAPILGEPNRFVLIGGFDVGAEALIPLLYVARRRVAAPGGDVHDRAFLAHPSRRRPRQAAVGSARQDGRWHAGRSPLPDGSPSGRDGSARKSCWSGPDLVFVEFIAGGALHAHLHGALDPDQRAVARPGERGSHAEPVEGALVFSQPPGTAAAHAPRAGGRDRADGGADRAGRDPVLRPATTSIRDSGSPRPAPGN